MEDGAPNLIEISMGFDLSGSEASQAIHAILIKLCKINNAPPTKDSSAA